MSDSLQSAVQAQKQSSFRDAWARVRQRNADRRAIKQMFQDAELELAKVTFEDIKTRMLEYPTTEQIALSVLVDLKRLDHPSVGLLETLPESELALAPKFSQKAIRFAARGERTLTRDFDMNDYPFGGISISKARRVKYQYSRKTAKESRARGEYIYLEQTVIGERVSPELARKRLLLERIGFKCPGQCKRVILDMRAWVVGKATRDRRWRSPVCRSCWIKWVAKVQPSTQSYLATAKDTRIPNGPDLCPRCDRRVTKRPHWRISSEGYAVCLWCRRAENKAGSDSQPDTEAPRAKLPARIIERRKKQSALAWLKTYVALPEVQNTCQVCKNPVQDLKQWRYIDRLEKHKEPCCVKCHSRWKRLGSPEGDFMLEAGTC